MPNQPKGATQFDNELERFALKLLRDFLPKSLKKGHEFGTVICQDNVTKKLSTNGPHESTYSDNAVDIGLREKNCGCSEGTTPVATVHTHPFTKKGGLTFSWGFDDPDMEMSDDYQLIGFLGAADGTFLRYDPATVKTVLIDGKRVQEIPLDDAGRVIPRSRKPQVVLNGNLLTGG